jgi:type I restriction enzyme S subunit
MVYTMSGTIGYAAVIPFDAENYSFSNTIARVRLPANSPNDVHYLSTFFNSHRGYLQSLRLVSGGIQGHVMPNPFKKLRVPSPLPKAQKYIGEKVRQAERLWERSRLCELDIHSALNSIVPPYSTTPQKWSRVSAQILGERFDNQPYRTHFLSLLNSVRSIRHEPLSRLATVTGGDPVPSELFGNSGVPLVRIRDISNAGFSNPEVRLPESYALKRVEALATEGMIVVGMDGEFRAQFFLREELPQLVNQRVAIVKAHGIRPELLAIWLSRTEGQYQLNRWTTQTTVGHIGLDDIRLVLVPRLEEAIENALADKALIARRCVWYAHTLITAAKLLVEALIEGKVTETELVNAHDALELSDITADRPLLRRLTHQGLDVPGQPPLFPELDALYALLAQTREEIQ